MVPKVFRLRGSSTYIFLFMGNERERGRGGVRGCVSRCVCLREQEYARVRARVCECVACVLCVHAAYVCVCVSARARTCIRAVCACERIRVCFGQYAWFSLHQTAVAHLQPLSTRHSLSLATSSTHMNHGCSKHFIWGRAQSAVGQKDSEPSANWRHFTGKISAYHFTPTVESTAVIFLPFRCCWQNYMNDRFLNVKKGEKT